MSITRVAFTLLLCAAMAGAEDAPVSHAVVVGPKGPLTLKVSETKGEDGVHLVFFSDREDPNWKMIEPGETRLMVMIHMSVGAGTHASGAFELADFETLFNMGKEAPERAITAYLVTNAGDEPMRFKLNKAEQGSLALGGTVTVHGEPEFKRSLSADFAFLFEGRQVAGQVRFTR